MNEKLKKRKKEKLSVIEKLQERLLFDGIFIVVVHAQWSGSMYWMFGFDQYT